MSTIEEFNLPKACNNCSSLRERIKRYYEVTDGINNEALGVGMEIEALEIAAGTSKESFYAAAEHTNRLLEAASKIGSSLRIQTKQEINVADAFCAGTIDPTSPTLQACGFIKSVAE